MRVSYHPDVRQDVAEAMRRYKALSTTLANDFKAELRRIVATAFTSLNWDFTEVTSNGFHTI